MNWGMPFRLKMDEFSEKFQTAFCEKSAWFRDKSASLREKGAWFLISRQKCVILRQKCVCSLYGGTVIYNMISHQMHCNVFGFPLMIELENWRMMMILAFQQSALSRQPGWFSYFLMWESIFVVNVSKCICCQCEIVVVWKSVNLLLELCGHKT